MNPQSVSSSNPSPNGLPLCSYLTAKGRSCRYPVTHRGATLCASHARRLPYAQPAANPLPDLPPELCAFTEISDITRFLGRLLVLLSENRISPRRAAVLGYIANSILNSLRAELRQTEDSEPEGLKINWTGIPRPERDLIKIAEEEAAAAASSQRSRRLVRRSDASITASEPPDTFATSQFARSTPDLRTQSSGPAATNQSAPNQIATQPAEELHTVSP